MKKTQHKLLQRQIKRYLNVALEKQSEEGLQELEVFFEAVSHAYHDFDIDRALRERSQELSSKELLAASAELVATQAKLLASAKMSALGEMAGGVAHEINTPLAVIIMRAEQLLENIGMDRYDKELFAKSIGIIVDTTERISRIIKGMKLFSRDQSGEPMISMAVSRIIADTLGLCQEKFKNQGLNLIVENKNDGQVECRPTEISQVLLNILNNAFDAIETLPDRWIKISVLDDGNAISIQITDSGAGVPKEIQEKIMQPFFTTKALGKGTGLGLSLSKGIAENHGGKLFIDSTCPNTCFILQLPKTQ